jgi:hypothetical protein
VSGTFAVQVAKAFGADVTRRVQPALPGPGHAKGKLVVTV